MLTIYPSCKQFIGTLKYIVSNLRDNDYQNYRSTKVKKVSRMIQTNLDIDLKTNTNISHLTSKRMTKAYLTAKIQSLVLLQWKPQIRSRDYLLLVLQENKSLVLISQDHLQEILSVNGLENMQTSN